MLIRALLAAALALLALPAAADQITGGGRGVTSIATSGCAGGGTITATGTITTTAGYRANTATTDTILAGDNCKLVSESNNAGVAVTLPQATGSFTTSYATCIVNANATQ